MGNEGFTSSNQNGLASRYNQEANLYLYFLGLLDLDFSYKRIALVYGSKSCCFI